MEMPGNHRSRSAFNQRLVETMEKMEAGHRAHVEALQERIKLLEEELYARGLEGMLIHTYFSRRRRDLVADYVEHVYSKDSESWTEGNPRMFLTGLDDEFDLSQFPVTGDDFKRRR